MTSAGADVLLIDVLSGAVPHVIPMGLIDLMNRLETSKLGLFPRETTPEMIRRARIVVLPLHWFYSIGPVSEWAARVREANPRARIVTGGYTAGAFDRQVLDARMADYVVRGDAEGPFPALVERLLDGKPVDGIPNLSFRDGKTPQSYAVTPEELGRADCRNLSWFPSLDRLALRLQTAREVTFVHPWVPVMRGCTLGCDGCFAAADVQQALCGRPPVVRPESAVAADLQYWSRHPDIRHCHFNSDFVSALGMGHARRILDGSLYDLSCYYEWYRIPSEEAMHLVRSSFRRLTAAFFFNMREACVDTGAVDCSAHERALAAAMEPWSRDEAVRFVIYADPVLASGRPEYARACLRLASRPRVRLYRYDSGVVPSLKSLDAAANDRLYASFRSRAVRDFPALKHRSLFFDAVYRRATVLVPIVHALGARRFVAELGATGVERR